MDQATVCQKCGVTGYKELLVYCRKCKIYAEHRYCLNELPKIEEVEVKWMCEQCKPWFSKAASNEQKCRQEQTVTRNHQRHKEKEIMWRAKIRYHIYRIPEDKVANGSYASKDDALKTAASAGLPLKSPGNTSRSISRSCEDGNLSRKRRKFILADEDLSDEEPQSDQVHQHLNKSKMQPNQPLIVSTSPMQTDEDTYMPPTAYAIGAPKMSHAGKSGVQLDISCLRTSTQHPGYLPAQPIIHSVWSSGAPPAMHSKSKRKASSENEEDKLPGKYVSGMQLFRKDFFNLPNESSESSSGTSRKITQVAKKWKSLTEEEKDCYNKKAKDLRIQARAAKGASSSRKGIRKLCRDIFLPIHEAMSRYEKEIEEGKRHAANNENLASSTSSPPKLPPKDDKATSGSKKPTVTVERRKKLITAQPKLQLASSERQKIESPTPDLGTSKPKIPSQPNKPPSKLSKHVTFRDITPFDRTAVSKPKIPSQRNKPPSESSKSVTFADITPFDSTEVPTYQVQHSTVRRPCRNLYTHFTAKVNDENESLRVVVDMFGTYLSRKNCCSLAPREWISNEVMRMAGRVFIGNQMVRDNRVTRHIFDPEFGAAVVQDAGGDGQLNKKTWKIDNVKCHFLPDKIGYKITSCDMIFAPVLYHAHWTCYVLDIKRKVIDVLDSMHNKSVNYRDHLDRAMKRRLEEVVKAVDSSIVIPKKGFAIALQSVPLQLNIYDCGIYVMKYFELWNNVPMNNFTQKELNKFREEILFSWINHAHNVKRNDALIDVTSTSQLQTRRVQPSKAPLREHGNLINLCIV